MGRLGADSSVLIGQIAYMGAISCTSPASLYNSKQVIRQLFASCSSITPCFTVMHMAVMKQNFKRLEIYKDAAVSAAMIWTSSRADESALQTPGPTRSHLGNGPQKYLSIFLLPGPIPAPDRPASGAADLQLLYPTISSVLSSVLSPLPSSSPSLLSYPPMKHHIVAALSLVPASSILTRKNTAILSKYQDGRAKLYCPQDASSEFGVGWYIPVPSCDRRLLLTHILDPLPGCLLGCLVTLSSIPMAPGDDATEPAQKRVRVDSTESAIPITHQDLGIIRPRLHATSLISEGHPIEGADAGRFLILNFDATKRQLSIATKPRSPHGSFRCVLHLKSHEINDQLSTVLEVTSRSRDSQDSEGALYTTVNFSLERRPDEDHLSLHFVLNWNPAPHTLRNAPQRNLSQRVLATFFEKSTALNGSQAPKLTPQVFYESTHMPSQADTESLSYDVPGLVARLYPFQRRALRWLLAREGVRWNGQRPDKTPVLETLPDETNPALPLSFCPAKDANGDNMFVSSLHHVVSRSVESFRQQERNLRGGILAEEMGLGKTVEAISLILLHQRPPTQNLVFDAYTSQELQPTSATLIVTPATLKKQWLSEFERHAPGLRVMLYEGMKSSKREDADLVAQMTDEVDVVITTYNVLQAEIHFAEPPPERAMRHARQYRRPKSPLVQLSWWRVCLDEAQQVESGVSNAAKVARSIPRINAWGITGTPVKENIKDLWGLLLFLHYEPFASSQLIWDVMTTENTSLFKPLFNRLALRHTKRAVRNELELPPQNRYVITMPFTAIEEQHYQTQFRQLARGFGLDDRGAPLHSDWDPENPEIQDRMKQALAQLRQTVLHPELGPGRLRALAQKNKPLRTIDEVLQVMIDSAEATVRADQRSYIISKLKRGQLLENSPRVREALAIWTEAKAQIQTLVQQSREQMETELDTAKRAGLLDDLEVAGSVSSDEDEGDPEKYKYASSYVFCF